MKCPHCTTSVHAAFNENVLGQETPRGVVGAIWHFASMNCPECGELIVRLRREEHPTTQRPQIAFLAWPRNATRLVPQEVDDRLAQDFAEAAAVLSISPKASAALSRRVLQDVLREKAGVKHANLNDEIQEVIDSDRAPSWLSEDLDAVRVVGNFAAHPIKSTDTGQVVEVEPGEAGWLLDVLERAFDFYFVQPDKARRQREALNEKLTEAGKPELKT